MRHHDFLQRLARPAGSKIVLLVLDGVAGNESASDAALRKSIRAAVPEAMILYAVTEDGAEAGADLVVEVTENGTVHCEERKNAPQS